MTHAFITKQAPLKEQYSKNPKSAVLTLKASGALDDIGITCKVDTGRGLAVAGIHERAGGTGLELCAGDMLLEALVACAGVALRAGAVMLDVPIDSAIVSAEGDVDLRGTLGVTEGVPVGFQNIRLNFDIKSGAPKEKVDSLIALTEQYCVVYHTLRNSPKIDVKMNMVQ